MDDKDLKIFQMLLINNRVTHREISEKLGISVTSVHRRVQNLIDQGIFSKFTANISTGYLKAIPVKVIGTSECTSIGCCTSGECTAANGCMKKISRRDYVEKVYHFGSNVTITTLLLKGLDELGPAVEHVRDSLEIKKPTVVLPCRVTSANTPIHKKYTGTAPLSKLDFNIIKAFHEDARKPLKDVANELDISVKTVRNHFDKMVEQGSIELGTNWKPEKTSGIYSVVHIDLNPGSDKNLYIAKMSQKFGPRILVSLEASNLPDLIVLSCWSPTMDQHVGMVEEMSQESDVALAYSRVIRSTWLFNSWRTKLLNDMCM
ncbi:MAG: HTH-type transcriptional regulator Ptr2 [Methanomassiliicoccales archaeon PtaU1.Bin124]|nr:MAG: HTH-type transcriptional regulator Ptr2 [Methanomassiliicoccales archaeon PtaU1.Bin124]